MPDETTTNTDAAANTPMEPQVIVPSIATEPVVESVLIVETPIVDQAVTIDTAEPVAVPEVVAAAEATTDPPVIEAVQVPVPIVDNIAQVETSAVSGAVPMVDIAEPVVVAVIAETTASTQSEALPSTPQQGLDEALRPKNNSKIPNAEAASLVTSFAPKITQSTVSPVSSIRGLVGKAHQATQARKRKKLDHAMGLFAKQASITNDDVEKHLHISDATASRYLGILEKENKIKRVGKTGQGVSYTKI